MSAKPFPTRKLGINGPAVSAVGFGSMGIGASYGKISMDEAFKTLTYAADRGVTFWDCADIYGETERILGKWFAHTGRRSEIFLCTKFGAAHPDNNMVPALNSKPSYIRKALERSLEQLQTSYVDLYYQHRIDPEVPVEVVMKTLCELVNEGKIKYIGMSECSADTLRRAKTIAGDKLVAIQMEYGPFSLEVEEEDFMNAIKETGVSVVAYSPLCRGLATGRFRSRDDFEKDDLRLYFPRFSEENFPKNIAIVDKLQGIGEKYNITSSQVALAWILAAHPNFIPIPGSRFVVRFEENVASAEVTLASEDVRAIRELVEAAHNVGGERYPAMWVSPGTCISLSEWKGETI